ncbi:MAG: MM0924 family protein [Pyrinomonadaceae bacterium]
MEDKILELVGRNVDINCGTGAMFRGVIEKADKGIVAIKDEDGEIIYVVLKRIIAFTECSEPHIKPGFIA